MECRVKICGVTSVADALAAVNLGADAIGLNFYERSPRRVDEATAAEIVTALPPHTEVVVLAVEEPWLETFARVRRLQGVKRVQVHRSVPEPWPGKDSISWLPAFPVKDESSLRAIEAFLQRCRREGAHAPSAVLLDAHRPGSFGGTGQVAPWELLAGWEPGVDVILAGGLTSENVGQAIRTVRPAMVDVASGVESSPGRKDVDKMKRFIAAARTAFL
jgi:phosphoribosylanthranilate isomerase